MDENRGLFRQPQNDQSNVDSFAVRFFFLLNGITVSFSYYLLFHDQTNAVRIFVPHRTVCCNENIHYRVPFQFYFMEMLIRIIILKIYLSLEFLRYYIIISNSIYDCNTNITLFYHFQLQKTQFLALGFEFGATRFEFGARTPCCSTVAPRGRHLTFRGARFKLCALTLTYKIDTSINSID